MPKEKQWLIKDLFFSDDLPREKVQRYHTRISEQRTILPINGAELSDVSTHNSSHSQGISAS